VWFVFSLFFIPASPPTGSEGTVHILTICFVAAREIMYWARLLSFLICIQVAFAMEKHII
jgi:hypothetical protein